MRWSTKPESGCDERNDEREEMLIGVDGRRSSGASGGGIRSERWREWSVEMFPQRCVGRLQGIRPRQADFHWDAFLGQEFQQFFGWPRRPRSRF
ncbi:unnamed protein product [Gadus morhua 'NCC']